MAKPEQTIAARLAQMGLTLPPPTAPAAFYLPMVRTGALLFSAGQLPLRDGTLAATGLVGRDLDTAAGAQAARQCAINLLAQIKAATGDLERIVQIVKLTVFVASAPDFAEQHLVADGASGFLVAALGERGRHARSAVGVAALPLGAPVEVEAVVETA